MTRAVDALDEHLDQLVEAVALRRYREHRALTFKVKPSAQDHLVVITSKVTTRGHDAVVIVHDATGIATLGLIGADYPHIVIALRKWADRVEAHYTK